MDVLSNREIAIALWLAVLAFYGLLSTKGSAIRDALFQVLSVLFSGSLLVVLLLAAFYTAVMVYTLSEIELWNISQLKNTIFWFFSVGLLNIFRLEKIKADKSFFRNSCFESLKLLALLQFVVGVYSFPLLIELLIVPLMVCVATMMSISGSDAKYLSLHKLLNGVLLIFGLCTMIYTAYMIVTDFDEIGSEKTFYDFIVPALLTVMYLPFVFGVIIYTSYETAFVGLNSSIPNAKLRFIAKLYAVLFINFRYRLVRRWVVYVGKVEVDSHKKLLQTFGHLRKLRRSEKRKALVPISQGWSPYSAKDFLMDEGVLTGDYNFLYDDQWIASSPMYEVGDGLTRSNFAYYVEGVEGVAKILKIKINVNDLKHSFEAHEKLSALSVMLVSKSLAMEMPVALQNALRDGIPYKEIYGNKQIVVTRDLWAGHRGGGYELKIEVVSG